MQEPDKRLRYLSKSEAERLVQCAAPHLKPIIRFALMTGARKANILSLTWEQIDFENKTITFYVKSRMEGGKRHIIPLYPALESLLHSLKPQDSGSIFLYKDAPIKNLKRAFSTALRNAEIKDFRFHDLRHTCASWMVQAGVELSVIKEVLGHQDIATTLRYAHLSKQVVSDNLEKVIGRKMAENLGSGKKGEDA